MAIKIKKILLCVSILLAMSLLLWVAQCVLMPKYVSDIPEGALISEYYANAGDNDVIFVGDCEVYENFSPVVLWEKYGITSYIRGSAQQLIWQSYYLLEETFKYETPKAVVFNVLSMKYGEPQSEAYNRLTLDGMKMSSSKISAIRASMTEEENMVTYLFPLLRYHSRWSEITDDDFRYMFGRTEQVGHNGYLMQTDIRPMEGLPDPIPLENYEFPDICMQYLDKMRLLCEKNGSELILIKAPSLYPHWYDEWEEQIITYSNKYDLKYYNFINVSDQIGIDWMIDTYDSGLHLNVNGAEKLTDYFGALLSSVHRLPDRRSDKDIASEWGKRIFEYYNEKEEKMYD